MMAVDNCIRCIDEDMMATRTFEIDPQKPFFIFDTDGNAHGVKFGEYLYDIRGDYIGYVRGGEYDVFTSVGEWVGVIYPDGRIVRKRTYPRRPLDPNRPKKQPRIRITARIPLPPMPGDLGFDKIDVLEWDEEVFKRISDFVPDLE